MPEDPPRSRLARRAAEEILVRVVRHYGGTPGFVLLGGVVPELLCNGSPIAHGGTVDVDVQARAAHGRPIHPSLVPRPRGRAGQALAGDAHLWRVPPRPAHSRQRPKLRYPVSCKSHHNGGVTALFRP